MHSRLLKIAYWISNDRQLFSMPCLFDKYRVTSIIETHRQWQEESVRRVKEKIKEKSCTTYGRLCNQVGNSKKPQNYLMSPIMQFLCIFGTKCAQVLTYLSRYLSALGYWNIEFEKSSLMNWNFCLVWTRILLPV